MVGNVRGRGAVVDAMNIHIPADWPAEGLNLPSPTVGGALQHAGDRRPVLVSFLRHFGCIFCREMIKDLRKAASTLEGFPAVVFVAQGTVGQARRAFARWWPSARVILDNDLRLYHHFGLDRGTVGQMFGPQVVACGIRAALKGNLVGRPVGDPWVMPGLFLVRGDSVVWRHTFDHAGDHPSMADILQAAEAQ